jgi:bacterioferritin-associated ferredoxin
MIVCVCKRVSDREIARHAASGMDFDDIQFMLGVATQCGRCEGCARDVVAMHREAAALPSSMPLSGQRIISLAVAA